MPKKALFLLKSRKIHRTPYTDLKHVYCLTGYQSCP